MKTSGCIEALEARIAPAKFSLIDVDGDLVTITTTKGTDADLAASGVVTTTPGGVPGGASIFTINLNGNPVFDGTSISITAKRGPLGGDGLVNVFGINAPGFDLGTVAVDGDLGFLVAGKNTPASKIAAINVFSSSGDQGWNLQCSVGSLTVKTDVRGASIAVLGASLGTLTLGGSLIGSDIYASGGTITVPNGTIGKVSIGGSIIGSAKDNTGIIKAKSINSVTVVGSLVGAGGANSGTIGTTDAAGTIGSLTIKGDVRGGSGGSSGHVESDGTIGALTLGGSLIGGNGSGVAGCIEAEKGIGKVKIGHDIVGGLANSATGIILSNAGIASVTIGGSLIGGSASGSGYVRAVGGNIGPVVIVGDLLGGPAGAGGVFPSDSGIISAQLGTTGDTQYASIASITIGGSVVGRGPTTNGQIFADGSIGPVKIAGDLRGGTGVNSGGLVAGQTLGRVTIDGSVLGGGGNSSGSISSTGKFDGISIGGSLVGGSAPDSGKITSGQTLGAVTIGGSVLGGSLGPSGFILGSQGIGKVTIGLDLVGGFGSATGLIQAPNGGIAGITIGGSVLGGTRGFSGWISAGGNIGPISIRGDLVAGSADSNGTLPTDTGGIAAQLGTANDNMFASITSITIGGSVVGRGGYTNGQIFSDGDIGPVKIGGDLRGGPNALSGSLYTGRSLGLVSIGGSVLGGGVTSAGLVGSAGKVEGVKIGGSLVGGSGPDSGAILGAGIGPISIFGDFIGGAGNNSGKIVSTGNIGAIYIGGNVEPGAGYYTQIIATDFGNNAITRLNIKSLTIAGSATRLTVIASSADASIGPVKVGGDWREGVIATGINSGSGGFGTNDDTEISPGDPEIFSKIASITIGGAVIGTQSVGGDHFGFVAQQIGALSIGGTKVPLEHGPGNDTDATLSRYILSASRDFTIHEVA